MTAYAKITDVLYKKQTMKKSKKSQNHISIVSRPGVFAMVFVFAISVFLAGFSVVSANNYQQQINTLEAQNNQINSEKSILGLEAGDLSGAISKLEEGISQKQAAINEYKAEVARLQEEIKKAEAELAKQKELLRETIKAIYIEGDITTLEMLASSDDLTDFFDKQQYRDTVQDKVKSTLDKITQLKLDLNTKKQKIENLIKEQESLKADLVSQNNEKNRLLSLNQSEQNKLEGEIKANQQKIAKLRAEAEAALARSLSSGSYKVSPVGPVSAGDVVGAVGNTGLSSGPHLHLEARTGSGITNPGPYIQAQPVNRPPAYISQSYGEANPLYSSGYHGGIDYASSSGSPIFAIRDGYLYRGCSNAMLGTRNNAYGYVAIVEHSNGMRSVYAHMSGGPPECNYNTYY